MVGALPVYREGGREGRGGGGRQGTNQEEREGGRGKNWSYASHLVTGGWI